MTDARTITDALGGRWSGSNGMVRCPPVMRTAPRA